MDAAARAPGRGVRAARAPGPSAIVVVGDHGEGLGDHGESQHGNLALPVHDARARSCSSGPGVDAGRERRAGEHAPRLPHHRSTGPASEPRTACAARMTEVVLGEAMKPFLDYGWQPQVMAVEGRHKAILAGRVEVYDVVADPAETRDLAAGDRTLPAGACARRCATTRCRRPTRRARRRASATRSARKLASLGYVERRRRARRAEGRAAAGGHGAALRRRSSEASGLFVARGVRARRSRCSSGSWRRTRTTSTPRCAWPPRTRRSGTTRRRSQTFRRAAEIAPGLAGRPHLPRAALRAGTRSGSRRCPLLEQIVAEIARSPAGARGAGAGARAAGRAWRRRSRCGRGSTRCGRRPPAELVRLGELAMAAGQTDVGHRRVRAGARGARARPSRNDLELGVLYLAARRFAEARDALDRVPPTHPDYPMALFKRAQVSVLLERARPAARIEARPPRAPTRRRGP